jgi:hypothetical protein
VGKRTERVYVLWCDFADSFREARVGELSDAYIGGLFSSGFKARRAALLYRFSGVGLFRRTRLRFWIGWQTVGEAHWTEGYFED